MKAHLRRNIFCKQCGKHYGVSFINVGGEYMCKDCYTKLNLPYTPETVKESISKEIEKREKLP